MISQLRTETGLVVSFLRNGGGPRAALVAGCTAMVSGLLLLVVTVLLYSVSGDPDERLSALVAESGLRGGYLFAVLLICLAPLVLLQQVVRLGTAAREQRLSALRVAGATPAEVRRLGALEVGVAALVGGLLGYPVFLALAAAFGGASPGQAVGGFLEPEVAEQLWLVPTSVHPAWWHVLLVAAGVGLLGVAAGAGTSRSLVISPLGVSRRAPRSAPRPWGLVFLLGAGVLFSVGAVTSRDDFELYALGCLFLLVLALISLAPSIARLVGTAVAARASSVPVLIAARRLRADPRPAGRAAAAVGAITLVAGGTSVVWSRFTALNPAGGRRTTDEAFYVVPFFLITGALFVALLLVTFSMAVHGVESLMDRSRSIASLAALGVSDRELARVQRWEVGLVAIPMGTFGVLVGAGSLSFGWSDGRFVVFPALASAVTIAVVWLAVLVSTWITRPWLRRATASVNLRTP